MLHVVPVNPGEQVQVHAVLSTFDVTDAAWLLQCVTVVHCITGTGVIGTLDAVRVAHARFPETSLTMMIL